MHLLMNFRNPMLSLMGVVGELGLASPKKWGSTFCTVHKHDRSLLKQAIGVGHASGRLLNGVAQLGLLTVRALIRSDAPDVLHRQHLQHTRLGTRRSAGRISV